MLITSEYLEQNRALHNAGNYGISGARWALPLLNLARRTGARDVLDYGCGQGLLGRALAPCSFEFREYDPAISGKDAAPAPADIVACTDVLEHIEPELLDAVLDDIARLSRCAVLLFVATATAHKTLPDGRNAHLIIEPSSWWLPRICARWELHQFQSFDHGFMTIGVKPC